MHHPTDRITHTTAFITPVVEHWLEREIAQWVHPMKDQSVYIGASILINDLNRKDLFSPGSGICTFEDFKLLMKEKPPTKEDFADEMLRAFKIFDKDGNNFIDADELRHVMTQLGEPLSEEQVNMMIQCADLNKDGKLDYQGTALTGSEKRRKKGNILF